MPAEIKPPLPEAEKNPLPATTTREEDIITAGQRHINLMWETTQAKIAVTVVYTNLILNSILCVGVIGLRLDVTVNQMALISLCLQPISLTMGIVIGFYFSRTNHTNVGGVGKRDQRNDDKR